MHRALAGRVDLLGEDVRSRTPEWRARHLSVVLTEPVDVGALTARELVGLGRYPYTDWLGRLTDADRASVDAAISAVHAEALAGREVKHLSDGERQRVLIARALAQEPKLMVLDEPTAYLDLPRRIETMGLLRRLVRETGVTVLLSTHHLDLALDCADRVWLLPLGGPLTIGAPEDVVLSGALERTFVSERLTFDPAEGTFRLHDDAPGWQGSPGSRPPVLVEGTGLARRWAEHALHRDGFAAVDAASWPGAATDSRSVEAPPPRLRVVGPTRLELEIDGERVACSSFRDVLLRLEQSPRLKPSRRPAAVASGTRAADRT
jgi:iron complex transport system ATP-binding protein